MRNIKFRGKTLKTNQWVYGMPVETEKRCWLVSSPGTSFADGDLMLYYIEVDPETVGQWTGLQDKNGVDIYEGDVIDIGIVPRKPRIGIVEWIKPYCSFLLHQQDPTFEDEFWGLYCSSTDNSSTAYRILGNIHDNPELVKP